MRQREKYDAEVQNLEDKPWKNEEFERWEEALPMLKECELEKVSRLCKAKTGVRCDGFHPKVPLDLTNATRREVVEFLEMVEQSERRPQQACTTMFFLISRNVSRVRCRLSSCQHYYAGGKR